MHLPEQWHIIEKECSPSTNTELKALAEQGAAEGTVLIAHRQTAGRGRLGRSFFSPPNTGLYLSVLLRPDGSPQESTRITTVAAVAAAKAAEQVCGTKVQIKWVNDLYRAGKKVCGILTEGQPIPNENRLAYAVCGVGFNLCPPKEGFPPEIAPIAGSLTDTFDPTLRMPLALAFLEEFRKDLALPFSEILEEYRSRSLLTGKTVFSPTDSFSGDATVLGIDEEGGLRIALSDGTEQILRGGEVSVRIRE